MLEHNNPWSVSRGIACVYNAWIAWWAQVECYARAMCLLNQREHVGYRKRYRRNREDKTLTPTHTRGWVPFTKPPTKWPTIAQNGDILDVIMKIFCVCCHPTYSRGRSTPFGIYLWVLSQRLITQEEGQRRASLFLTCISTMVNAFRASKKVTRTPEAGRIHRTFTLIDFFSIERVPQIPIETCKHVLFGAV